MAENVAMWCEWVASLHLFYNCDNGLVVELPMDHAFDVFNHELTTAWGFYPRVPQALRNSNSVSVDV